MADIWLDWFCCECMVCICWEGKYSLYKYTKCQPPHPFAGTEDVDDLEFVCLFNYYTELAIKSPHNLLQVILEN